MKFVYAPEGIEPRSWHFDPGSIPSNEGEEIERRTGLLFDDWVERAQNGSIIAVHALLYIFLRRDKPGLRWEQVQFTTSEYSWEMTEDEEVNLLRFIEEQVAAGRELNDDQRETLDDLRERVGHKLEKSDAEPAPRHAHEDDDPKGRVVSLT